MRELKQDLKTAGYSLEEAYFFKENRKAIARLKARSGTQTAAPKDVDEVGLEEIDGAEYEERKAA